MIEIIKVSECANPALSTILPPLKAILTLIQIIGPILLIISLVVQFSQSMMNPEENKNMKKIITTIIAILLLFFTPMLINAVMSMLGDDFTISECWNKAGKGNNNGKTPEYQDPNKGKERSKIIDDNSSSGYEKGEETDNNDDNDNNNNDDNNNDNNNNNNDNNDDGTNNGNDDTEGEKIDPGPRL